MQQLISSRLHYRSLSEKEATPRYAQWLNDPRVNQYLEIRHQQHDVNSCLLFIRTMNSSETDHLFGIFLKDSNQHIGNIKIGFIDQHYKTGQISLFIGEPDCWKKGYASESINSLTKYGFTALGLERIEAGCYASNLGSKHAFLKAGYRQEGVFRHKFILNGNREDCLWFAALRSEWHEPHY